MCKLQEQRLFRWKSMASWVLKVTMCNIIFIIGICKSAIAFHSAISVDTAELNFTRIERFLLPFKSTGNCIYVYPTTRQSSHYKRKAYRDCTNKFTLRNYISSSQ
jgi:hypothetical protein